jgi:hypothetical protein
MEASSLDATDRFLSWHRSGEPLPLDRTVRDYARTAKDTVAASTAARYRKFAERLARRLGAVDLRLLQKEDVGRFVRAEQADGRAPDPTINASSTPPTPVRARVTQARVGPAGVPVFGSNRGIAGRAATRSRRSPRRSRRC